MHKLRFFTIIKRERFRAIKRAEYTVGIVFTTFDAIDGTSDDLRVVVDLETTPETVQLAGSFLE